MAFRHNDYMNSTKQVKFFHSESGKMIVGTTTDPMWLSTIQITYKVGNSLRAAHIHSSKVEVL
jgi:hypothetical protein